MPTLTSVEEVLHFFEEQMMLMNERLLKLEGERFTNQAVIRRLLMFVVMPEEERRRVWDESLEMDRLDWTAFLEGGDEATRATIGAAIAAIERFKIDNIDPKRPTLSVIDGGKP